MKTDLFQSCGHCWVFEICWHSECSTFTTSSFRIWNSSIGIPSPPVALFIVLLSKACLTSHSRMSGSRWVITPSWYSRSQIRLFCLSPEPAQIHAHQVCDAIQPSLPLSSPFPSAFLLSQHQSLSQRVSSLHQLAKVLKLQLQHQPFQGILRTDCLQID